MKGSRSIALVSGSVALTLSALPASASDYSLPLDSVHYHQYITAYYDLGGTQDWNCGSKTYSGHRGTDIGIGGFGPQAEGRPVLAAANGVVVSTHDGEPDMCTSGACGGGSGYGNHVVVEHPDGKRTIYAHFKRFSLLVETGQSVSCGQKLGEVGSSGNSTGPHLHFETRGGQALATADDPFTGPCGGAISWWLDQGSYDALPVLTCTDFVLPWPRLALHGEVTEIGGTPAHAEEQRAPWGTPIVQQFVVHNASNPLADGVANGLRVGFELDPALRVTDWWIESSCEDGLCSSPATDDPANPAPAAIGEAFALELDSLPPGAQTRISLVLVAEADPQEAGPAQTRFFVANVDEVYAKASWDAAFEDASGQQTWNDGDLRLAVTVFLEGEVDGDEPTPGGAGDGDPSPDPDPGNDPPATDDGAGALPGGYGELEDGEGCACRHTTVPDHPWALVLWVLAFRRKRRARVPSSNRRGLSA